MAVWLFQANKNEYDLVEKAASLLGKNDWWSIKQYRDEMKPGQVALFWQSGEKAGIYAVGELTSEPYLASSDVGDDWRIDVRYDRLLELPILKVDLTSNPVLQHLDVLKREWSKNPFRVSEDEWSNLQEFFPEDSSEVSRHRSDTAKIAGPIDGEKLYQERARVALPLLVRQAEAGVPIVYSDFATELKMSNPRNLNYVLGSIGVSLQRLSEKWGETIPPIQCLVVNKNTRLPGKGISWFLLKNDEFSALSLRQKREIVQAALQHIYSYRRWREVLSTLSLKPSETEFANIVDAAGRSFGSGGESPQHMALKIFVANHPAIIGLGANTPAGVTECPLPSGDCLDISFEKTNSWIAVEIKSSISDEADITRGLFQCVKYLAVMEAVLIANRKQPNARALLVLEGQLPQRLVPLKNLLQVEVIEGIRPTL